MRSHTQSLQNAYQRYIECLNSRDLSGLGQFVAENVIHNGRHLGLAGYRDMIAGNYDDIPDLRFAVDLLICDPPHIASRLRFDCHPKASFLGVPVDGRRVVFNENVFYQYIAGKISEVWSVIDKPEIEKQLTISPSP